MPHPPSGQPNDADSGFEPGGGSARDARGGVPPLLRMLLEDTGVGVAILDEQARVLHGNDALAELLDPDAPVDGSALHDLLPDTAADEWVRAAQDAVHAHGPRRIHGFLRGRLVLTTFRPVPGDALGRSERRLVVAVFRPLSGRSSDADVAGSYRAQHDDDRGLAQLTAREAEVLRYIGLGLSTAEIARKLHRSVKTIEWHRVSLGNKLNVDNRVELARIAIRAGISELGPPHDANGAGSS